MSTEDIEGQCLSISSNFREVVSGVTETAERAFHHTAQIGRLEFDVDSEWSYAAGQDICALRDFWPARRLMAVLQHLPNLQAKLHGRQRGKEVYVICNSIQESRVMRFVRMTTLIVGLLGVAGFNAVAQDLPFIQHQNLVYAEAHGIGLIMDVFVPSGDKNGLAIIDVVSGAWHSDRSKIRDHMLTQSFHIFCKKGYTVFAIRPGSITKFSALEMRANLNQGIHWVKSHASEYGIDPERIGMMGSSAGGHLACLTAVTAEDGTAVDGKKPSTGDTRVKAVAVFFPPTDFLQYGDKVIDPSADDKLGKITRKLADIESENKPTADEMSQQLAKISPARLVTAKAPPFLLIHGDADPLVPLQQSEVMVAALKNAGVAAELIVKKGGQHPWFTIHEEVKILADWFDTNLAKP